jgi:hypothetical protein
MKGIKITVMMLIFCQAVVAQSKTAEEITTKHVERLDSKVQLTAEQKSNVASIVLSSTQKIQALKEDGSSSPEERKAIKQAERKKIKELLTAEQNAKLKEARSQDDKLANKKTKAVKQEHREAKKAAKSELLVKRLAFENNLSASEKEAINKARELQPTKIKGKEAKSALSPDEKSARKAQMKEVQKLLKPVISAHQNELDEIKSTLPTKPESAKVKADKKGTQKSKFATKFLLMQ